MINDCQRATKEFTDDRLRLAQHGDRKVFSSSYAIHQLTDDDDRHELSTVRQGEDEPILNTIETVRRLLPIARELHLMQIEVENGSKVSGQ